MGPSPLLTSLPLLVPLTRILASSSSSSSFNLIPLPCPSTSLTPLLLIFSLAQLPIILRWLFDSYFSSSSGECFPLFLHLHQGHICTYLVLPAIYIALIYHCCQHVLLPITLFWSPHSSSTSLPCRQMSHSSRLNQFNSAARTFSRLKLESEKIFAPIVGASQQASEQASKEKQSHRASETE